MKHVMFVYMLLWKLIVIHVVLEKMASCLMSSFKLAYIKGYFNNS